MGNSEKLKKLSGDSGNIYQNFVLFPWKPCSISDVSIRK